MPKDSFQAVGGALAGEAANDIGQNLADFVSKVARAELERRGSAITRGAFVLVSRSAPLGRPRRNLYEFLMSSLLA